MPKLKAPMFSVPANPPSEEFRRIAEEQQPMLLRMAFRLCGDTATAQDLVQEALFRAWRGFDRFQPGTNAAAWLVTILTNLFYDDLRHKVVVARAESELVVTAAAEREPIMTVTDAELYAAIRALPRHLRKVVELCYLRQMRYHEAAERLGIPSSTIGTRLLRARARLKELLSGKHKKR